MRQSLRLGVIAFGAGLALASCSPQRTLPASTPRGTGPVFVPTAAPSGLGEPGVQWMKLTAPNLGVMLAAVARPPGAGPFPTLIILHGTHGFARQYVRLARDMARNGVLAIAVCWFSGRSGAGLRYVTPIDCPEAPPMSVASSAVAMNTLDAIVQAVRTVPNVMKDRVALFGHSRGGGAVLHYVLGKGSIQAAVLNSAGYPAEVSDRVSEIQTPILILHGIADSPSDGGSAMTDIRMARSFEEALRRAGKQVEVTYFDGGHNAIFTSSDQYDAEVQQIVRFLKRVLADKRVLAECSQLN